MARRDLIFRVFVSSTFGDLIAERNALQARVFPALRKYCQEHGARFQAIDLRWGVSAEAALDQQTMNICFQELARCQEMSPRPNFVILLGERYGWRPLPAQIPVVEFEEILSKVPEKEKDLLCGDHDVVSWVEGAQVRRTGWYRKDLNAAPPEYVLQARTVTFPDSASDDDKRGMKTAEAEDWRRIESQMRSLLLAAIDELDWPADDDRREKYVHSATHQEIEHGALYPGLDSESHVLAYFRAISGAPGDGSATGFVDSGENKDDLEALKDRLRGRLPDEHIFEYEAEWKRVEVRNCPDAPPLDVDREPDLARLCDRVLQDLQAIIESELRAFQQRPELDREMEAHGEFGVERSRHFIGRQDVLERISLYLKDEKETRPLVVHGVSGTGKTALMARAWLTLTDPKQAVARFIGATPGSADLRSLLRSLCEQLGIGAPPAEMNDLVKAFRNRLGGPEPGQAEGSTPAPGPAVVFLDGLDQLNPTDNARMLYWLPRTLAPGVKLVVSALEGAGGAEKGQREDPFDIARRIWPESLAKVGPLGLDNGKTLLATWLAKGEPARTLQDVQRDDILAKFKEDGRPLYLKVAFEEARLWRSWDGLPCGADAEPGLFGTVEGILVDMLDRLERPRNHGRLLVERALGGIAAAKNGLTEDELLDVLWRDEEFRRDYFERNPESPGEVDRLPVVIWSRLYADLKPYMAQRRADGTVVMNSYHRQVGEAVQTRYLASEEARAQAHLRLAKYFDTLDFWAESLEAQRARAKRLPPTPRPANVRKVVELPYHRLEVAKLLVKDDAKSPHWDAVADLLTNWQFLEAKAEADPNFREQEVKEPPAQSEAAKQ